MSRFSRALLAAALLSLVAFIPAGPAEAEYMGIKVEVGGPTTFVYLGGDPEAQEGSAAICAAGQGVTVHFAFQAPTPGCPASVPPETETVSIPPSGGGGPSFPCSDEATCRALVEELIGGDGGGDEEPPQRHCTGATGGEATCVDFGDGNFILGGFDGDSHGELGVCAGGAYFFVAGPDSPDEGAGGSCPGAGAAPAGGEEPEPEPAQDSDGDGLADASDRCPASAAGTTDGCPPQSPSGSSTSSTESSSTTGDTQTTQRPASPDPPAESPVLDITRDALRVSRRGWVGIPLTCRTTRTPCIGTLQLTATRRTRDGRRVRVLLAEARVHMDAGDTATRRVRITRRGRELLARRSPLRTLARITMTDGAATVASAERLTLRR